MGITFIVFRELDSSVAEVDRYLEMFVRENRQCVT